MEKDVGHEMATGVHAGYLITGSPDLLANGVQKECSSKVV